MTHGKTLKLVPGGRTPAEACNLTLCMQQWIDENPCGAVIPLAPGHFEAANTIFLRGLGVRVVGSGPGTHFHSSAAHHMGPPERWGLAFDVRPKQPGKMWELLEVGRDYIAFTNLGGTKPPEVVWLTQGRGGIEGGAEFAPCEWVTVAATQSVPGRSVITFHRPLTHSYHLRPEETDPERRPHLRFVMFPQDVAIGCSIENMTIHLAAGSDIAIGAHYAQDLTLADLWLEDEPTPTNRGLGGVCLTGCEDSLVQRVKTRETGPIALNSCTRVRVEDCIARWVAAEEGCLDVSFRGCHLYPAVAGLEQAMSAMRSAQSERVQFVDNVVHSTMVRAMSGWATRSRDVRFVRNRVLPELHITGGNWPWGSIDAEASSQVVACWNQIDLNKSGTMPAGNRVFDAGGNVPRYAEAAS